MVTQRTLVTTVLYVTTVPADSARLVDQQRSFSCSCNMISQSQLLGQNHDGHPDTGGSSAMTFNLHARTHAATAGFNKDFSKGREELLRKNISTLDRVFFHSSIDQPIQLIDFRYTVC